MKKPTRELTVRTPQVQSQQWPNPEQLADQEHLRARRGGLSFERKTGNGSDTLATGGGDSQEEHKGKRKQTHASFAGQQSPLLAKSYGENSLSLRKGMRKREEGREGHARSRKKNNCLKREV